MEYVKGRVSILYYIGIHDIDAIQWISGKKITSVFAKKIDKLGAFGEDGYALLFTFDNGAAGTMDIGWNFPAAYPVGLTRIDIVGTKGALFFDMAEEGIHAFVDKNVPISPSFGFLGGKMVGAFLDQIQHFAGCLLSGDAFAVDTEEVVYSVKVVEAALRSAESGKLEDVI
jgi:myo-inositol 2-dehydrogenase/D-chiro-inositol 1-dehydrogenase